MTSENNKISTTFDRKGYKVLYKTDIKTADSVIELNVKESRIFRFIEVVQITNNVEIRITVSRHNFDEFVMALKNMLIYSTLNSKPITNQNSNKRNKKFTLKTEMTTDEKWHYAFELVLDDDERVLRLISTKGRQLTDILLPVSELEEFITKCEIILKTFIDINNINAQSSKKYSSTKNKHRYQNDWREYLYNYANRTSSSDRTIGGRSNKLKVLEYPVPRQIVYDDKTLNLEIVEGNKSFLRITERIKEKIKDSVHVPIECLEHFENSVKEIFIEIVNMDYRYENSSD